MNTKTIKFDLNKYKLYEKIKAKQGDTKSRFLLFQLLDGSIPFNLKNRSVRAYMIKPDGREIFNDLIVNNYNLGYCTLELTNQVLAAQGIVKIELMVTEGDKKLTSSVFELEVVKSINSEKSIVSTNEFTALLNGLAALSEYDNYKNSVKEMEINKANKAEVEEKFISVEEKIKNNSEQLEYIENKNNSDSIKNNPYFVTTFNAHDGYKLDMYISYKVNEFIPINGNGILLDEYVRDPSPLFYNGKFYIAFTSNGIAIAESEDLVNWKVMRVRNNGTERFMAPEFIIDNEDIYMALSYSNGSKTDDNLYIYKTLILKGNEDLTQWVDVNFLNINAALYNYIDTSFLKVDSKWHIFLKIENTGVIQHYESDNLIGLYTLVNTISTNRPCEGITCKKRENKYCLYLDNYTDGYASVIYSYDLINWNNEETINVTDGTRTQHFDMIELNEESKIIVNNAIKKYNVENIGFKQSRNRYGNRLLKVKHFMNGTIFNPPIFDNTIYTFDDDDDENIIITEINVPNPQNHYEINFMYTRGGTDDEFNDGITLKNTFASDITGNGGIRTPYYSDFLIGHQLRSSLVKLIYKGRDYQNKNYWIIESNYKEYIVPKTVYLENLAVNSVIDTLYPLNNQYYALGQDINITINKINTSKMSKDGKFYIVMKLSNLTDKTITIKSGGNGNNFIGRRSKDLVINETDLIYSFMKENGISTCRQIGN